MTPVIDHEIATHDHAPKQEFSVVPPEPQAGMKRMMAAGVLGLAAVALVVAAPELGVGGIIGGVVVGSSSAIVTLFARK